MYHTVKINTKSMFPFHELTLLCMCVFCGSMTTSSRVTTLWKDRNH